MKYRIENGKYYLCDGDDVVYVCDEVAIGYSDDGNGTVVLHKHGNVDLVTQWVEKSKVAYRRAGFSDMADELYVVNATERGWSVDKINRCLDTCGYLGRVVERPPKGCLHVADETNGPD